MTENSKLEKVTLEATGKIITAQISFKIADERKKEFAFYVLKNDVRIHVQWYTKDASFSFDTEGNPGQYRVIGFIKTDDGTVLSARSNPVFANRIFVTATEFPNVDQSQLAYEFNGKSWRLPVMHYPRPENRLFIMMSSAVDRSKVVLPVFNRWTWAKEGLFPGTTICVADPTLDMHSDLALGWYLGNNQSDPLDDLTDFIVEYARARNIPQSNIVVWGSSAGGFAALALAAKIDGSIAVAVNAQTDPLSYEAVEQVNLVRKVCFENATPDVIRRKFPMRIDMSSVWNEVQKSRAIMVQNRQDKHHHNVHFAPMWQALGGNLTPGWSTARQHHAWLYDDNRGHAPETKEMVQEILTLILRLQIGAEHLSEAR